LFLNNSNREREREKKEKVNEERRVEKAALKKEQPVIK